MNASDRMLVALDYPSLEGAAPMMDKLSRLVGGFKVASTLCTEEGVPRATKARNALASGKVLFLDLKYFDIPEQVAGAVRAAVRQGADIINVHAKGGSKMMKAAAGAAFHEAAALGVDRPKIIAVTVLTSMSYDDLVELGEVPIIERSTKEELIEAQDAAMRERVLLLARLAKESGMDGVVCSAQEVKLLREELGPDFLLVVPGIRLPEADKHDQKRVGTPDQAIRDGADYLVIGRDFTKADDPEQVAQKYTELIDLGLAQRAA